MKNLIEIIKDQNVSVEERLDIFNYIRAIQHEVRDTSRDSYYNQAVVEIIGLTPDERLEELYHKIIADISKIEELLVALRKPDDACDYLVDSFNTIINCLKERKVTSLIIMALNDAVSAFTKYSNDNVTAFANELKCYKLLAEEANIKEWYESLIEVAEHHEEYRSNPIVLMYTASAYKQLGGRLNLAKAEIIYEKLIHLGLSPNMIKR